MVIRDLRERLRESQKEARGALAGGVAGRYRRRMSSWSWTPRGIVLACGSLVACLPESPPSWIVDRPSALAVRVEVAGRGPEGVPPPRPNSVVAEIAPGDTFRVVPFTVDIDGPLDLGPLDPTWYVCGPSSCPRDLAAAKEPAACGYVLDLEALPCHLGRGMPAARMGTPGTLVDIVREYQVMMIAGSPGGPTTDECRERLRRSDDEPTSVRDCLIASGALRLGPDWRLVQLAEEFGLVDHLPADLFQPEILASEPSLAPIISALDVTITPGKGEARTTTVPGAVSVYLRGGDEVEIRVTPTPESTQTYYFLMGDDADSLAFGMVAESSMIRWFFTGDALALPGSGVARWRAPPEPCAEYLYILRDDRRSVAWTWLRLVVEGP